MWFVNKQARDGNSEVCGAYFSQRGNYDFLRLQLGHAESDVNVWAGEAEHAVGMPQASPSIYRCPNIKFLFLRSRGLGLISEKEIFHAISKWKDLESMDVDDSCLTSKILSAIHSSCKDFVSLTTVAGRLTKYTALDIVRCLPKLKSINLSYTILSIDTLLVILKGCKELESLDITGCRHLGLGLGWQQIRKYAAGLKSFKCDGGLFHDIFDLEDSEEGIAGVEDSEEDEELE